MMEIASNDASTTEMSQSGSAESLAATATSIGKQAKDLVTARISDGAGKSAAALGDVAEALHETSKQLEGNIASPYVEKAASELDRLANFVRNADGAEITSSVEGFAHREPLLFLGGAFAIGLFGARFLKSSSHRRAVARPEFS